jgi:MIP family channel proteins
MQMIHLPPLYPPKTGHNSTPKLILRSLMAEMLGTCFLVYLGCGAVLNAARTGNADATAVALSFGFASYVMVYAVGSMSGGHLNPAITTAFLFSGSLSVIEWGLYVIAQMLGGIAGAGFLDVTNSGAYGPGNPAGIAAACNYIHEDGMHERQAFFLEYLLTMLLTFVVYAVVDPSNHTQENATSGPHAVGMAVAGCHLVATSVTGTSINPARSFGPAVIAGGDFVPGKSFDCWEHHWVFWVAPLCGAITSSLLYTYYFDMGDKVNTAAISPLDVENMAPMIDQAIDDVVSELMNGAVVEQTEQKQAEQQKPADVTDAAVDEILGGV